MENLLEVIMLHVMKSNEHTREMQTCMFEIRDCLLQLHVGEESGCAPSLGDMQLLDAEQVMSILQISRTTYYRFVKEGKLQPRKIGDRHCYYMSDLDKMIEESRRRGRI